MQHHIYVSLSTFAEENPAPLDLLKQSGIPFSLNKTGKRINGQALVEAAKSATGIVAGVEEYNNDILNQLPKLICISRCGVGLDSIDLTAARSRNVTIKNTPDIVIEPVKDLTIGLIYDCLRKITFQTNLLKNQEWKKIIGRNLSGCIVGIAGTGRIGKSVAETLRKLGATVIAFDIAPSHAWAAEFGIQYVEHEQLLQSADIISLHLSGASEPFLSEKHFDVLKKDVAIINTSRGGCIAEAALFDFLTANPQACAALDVFPEEPYKGKLLSLQNIIATPHIATFTVESRLRMEMEAVQNLIEALPGR